MNGVMFDGVHSDSWGIILTGAEIGSPEVKGSTIDIPGADGVLDLTIALDGSAHYGNRELQLTFETTSCYSGTSWAELLSSVSSALHGQQKTIIFDDDPEWAYQGRCYVDSFETSRYHQTLVIRCDCAPYKVGTTDSTQRSL